MSESELSALKQAEPVGEIDYDSDMNRYYIPVHSDWEIQTQGNGSSFRIANCKTGERWLVLDKHLHAVLENMARDINTTPQPDRTAELEAALREALKGKGSDPK